VTIQRLAASARRGRKLVMLTAYDYPTARLLDAAGVDVVLVGDSLGMVVLGYPTTAPVTMAAMCHHARAVRRAVERALLVADLPLVSLRRGLRAVRDAEQLVRRIGCDAVKVEWRPGILATVEAMVRHRIPVLGHVGLTPQLVDDPSGFRVQGRTAADARRILDQAVALERAGCFALVIECVPDRVAALITRRLRIPTIGIGAGPSCDGQVLVLHDLVGLHQGHTPRFVKRYTDVSEMIRRAVARFGDEVRRGRFPSAAQRFTISDEEFQRLKQLLHP
jgi:3-methyl-2-oxobutanoate hydroxymethyltransferase